MGSHSSANRFASAICAGVILAATSLRSFTAMESDGARETARLSHMQAVTVELGQAVSRGEEIGQVGKSGSAAVPHVHLELCTFDCTSHADGDFSGTEDPLAIAEGCYDSNRTYPTDRLVITFPVRCLYWVRWR